MQKTVLEICHKEKVYNVTQLQYDVSWMMTKTLAFLSNHKLLVQEMACKY